MWWVHWLATLRSGWRSRGARVVFFLGLVVLLSAWLGGVFSARQPQAVALDVGLSAIRVVCLLLGLYWVQELVFRDFERRTVLFVLAYPQARWQYLLGRYLGVMTLMGAALLSLSLATLAAGWLALGDYQQATPPQVGWIYWKVVGLVYLDLVVVLAFALMVASVATVAMMPFFLGLAFALAARTFGPALAYLIANASSAEQLGQHYLAMLSALQWVFPDLSRLDVRAEVLYGRPESASMLMPAVGAATYALLLICVAVFLFRRRQFS